MKAKNPPTVFFKAVLGGDGHDATPRPVKGLHLIRQQIFVGVHHPLRKDADGQDTRLEKFPFLKL